MENKDKEILFSEEAQRMFAEMLAKWLMPDIKILEQLSPPSSNIEVNEDKWTFEIKENKDGISPS